MFVVQAKYPFHHSMLVLIVFYSLSRCPQIYAAFISFPSAKKGEKSLSSCRAGIVDKEQQRNSRGPPSLFCPDFFASDLCLCPPPTPHYTELPDMLRSVTQRNLQRFHQSMEVTQRSPFRHHADRASNIIYRERAQQGNNTVSSQAISAICRRQKGGSEEQDISVCHAQRDQEKEEEAPVPNAVCP